jgi:hypothetical protein
MMPDAGKRRPKDEDLDPILELLWDGQSLRSACLKLGLDTPSVSKWLDEDEKRRQQYERAREGRAEYLQEDAITLNRAAALAAQVNGKKVDASGAKGYLEAVKWATARMAPKKAPVDRHLVNLAFGDLSDEELSQRLATIGRPVETED